MKFLAISLRLILWSTFAIFCGFVLISSALYLYLGPSLPSVEILKNIQLQTPMRIYSADNKLIAEIGEKRRTPLRFDQIPPAFVQALTAVEDRNFEHHIGVDAKGFTRAVLQFLSSGEKGGGGSTITQQVAKNHFFSHKKMFTRKFKEILLAIQMEQILSKEEIFELYINKIFLGHRSYGFQAAAQVYYGRDINDLTLPELAMLAGLPQRPSGANPISYPSAAIKRRNRVLKDMFEIGYISEPTYQEAIATPLSAGFHGNNPEFTAPWVAEMVRDNMIDRFGQEPAYTEGFRVYTTINSNLQTAANKAVQKGLISYSKRHGYRGVYRKLGLDGNLDPHRQQLAWLKEIKNELNYGGLSAAVVSRVDDKQLYVLDKAGNLITLAWEQISWARKYLDHSEQGPKIKTAAEIAAPGDVIWVENIEGVWNLAQMPHVQGALVAMNPYNGAIQSLVGGFDFKRNKYNRVTQAKRQPGSNIKPFLYSAALSKGHTAATIINDSPITIEDKVLETTWRPKNSGYNFSGPIRLREALYRSKNVVSIRLLQEMGINPTIDFISKFGLEPNSLPKNLTLALGSASVPPMKIMEGYSVIANGGYKVDPYLIQRIEDHAGNILFEADPRIVCSECLDRQTNSDDENALLAALDDEQSEIEEEVLDPNTPLALPQPLEKELVAPRILEPRIAFVMDSILRDVVKKGTGRRALALGRQDLAGKTGTTNDGVDAWFSGYNPDIVATAWVGFDQPSSLGRYDGRSEWGGSAALPIWIDYMKVALEGKSERALPQPTGLISTRIDPKTGLLARPGQSDAVFEIFREELAPREQALEEVQMVFEREETIEDLERAIEGEAPLNTEPEEVSPEMLF